MIEIHHSNQNDLSDDNINRLHDLINQVYAEAEDGMWLKNSNRVTKAEVREMLENEELILAISDGKIVGSLKKLLIDKTTCEFGILVADKTYRGQRVGSALVSEFESWATAAGYKILQLTLLTPSSWKQPSKEFLKKWYSRIGYKPERPESFNQRYPHRTHEMATQCDFTVWKKELG